MERSAVEALVAAYPQLTVERASNWCEARRSLLLERITPAAPLSLSVSSGCAASGAATHARGLAADAAHALARLDAGQATTCEQCGDTLPFDRIDSAPSAVRCTGCARTYDLDTRWCR